MTARVTAARPWAWGSRRGAREAGRSGIGLSDVGFRGVAQDLADRLGLDLDVPMGRLSRGNRQKIALVQALYHRPPLLILDEPSTGLDPFVQDAFLQKLREASDEGRQSSCPRTCSARSSGCATG